MLDSPANLCKDRLFYGLWSIATLDLLRNGGGTAKSGRPPRPAGAFCVKRHCNVNMLHAIGAEKGPFFSAHPFASGRAT